MSNGINLAVPPEVTQAELDDHVAAADPHTGYRLESVAIAAADVAADVATQAELDTHTALTTTAHGGIYTPRPQLALTAQGLIAETCERGNASGSQILTVQRIQGRILGLRAGDLVTNLHCITSVTGAGAGYARMALFSTASAQLAVSGDANAAFIGAAGLLTIPLATPYTVLADGGFYVCVLTDLATTQPSLRAGPVFTASGVAIGSGSMPVVLQSSQASFPATATFTTSTLAPWFGVS